MQPHLEKCLSLITFKKVWVVKKSGNSSVGRAQPCQGWGRGSESRFPLDILNNKPFAQVAELVDAHVSGACAAMRAGSSPVLGTIIQNAYVGEVAELVDALL